jgi:hypothetical protein
VNVHGDGRVGHVGWDVAVEVPLLDDAVFELTATCAMGCEGPKATPA